jgi:hypothetical protein
MLLMHGLDDSRAIAKLDYCGFCTQQWRAEMRLRAKSGLQVNRVFGGVTFQGFFLPGRRERKLSANI